MGTPWKFSSDHFSLLRKLQNQGQQSMKMGKILRVEQQSKGVKLSSRSMVEGMEWTCKMTENRSAYLEL